MWTIWTTFVSILEQILLVLALLTGSIGFGIILFTICTRMVILPLTLKSIRSSRRMQEVQPLMKEIQRKYGKDQKKLQEEMLKLYSEHKINPVGGCLPMLLQLPIFFGVYQAVAHLMLPEWREFLNPAVRAAVEDSDVSQLLQLPFTGAIWQALEVQNNPSIIKVLLEQPFLGIDLGSSPFFEGEFQGVQYLILPIISIVFQLTQQLMAMPRVQDPQQKMMTQMMMFMPLVFGYIAFTFPAGAVLYWATSSVIGVIQQYFITGWGSLVNYLKFLPPDKTPQPALATASVASLDGSSTAVLDERPTFWGVLRPLTEAEVPTGGEESNKAAASAESDTSTDTSLEQTHTEARRPNKQKASSRRVRRRR